MRSHSFRSYAAEALFVALIFTGCSANPSGPTTPTFQPSSGDRDSSIDRTAVPGKSVWSFRPERFKLNLSRPSWMKVAPPGYKDGTVMVAEFGATSVFSFPKENRGNQAPLVCEAASSTNGIGVDRAKNLWIPNGRANTTTEYAPNCGPAKLTIADPTGEPADVGFDRKGGVYILNINDTSGAPTVGVYTRSGNLVRTLSDPSFSVLFGIGTDRSDNVFVSNLQSNNVGNVVEFANGAMPGKVLSGVALGLPGSPALDSKGNLVITDWLAETINVYAPPYTTQGTTSELMGFSIWCPLGQYEKRLYCGDAENGSIDVYAYPGLAYLYSYSSGLSADALVTGVAPAPPSPL